MRRLFGLWPGTVPAQHLACGSGRADSWAHLHQSVQLFTRVVSGAARSPGKMEPGQLSLLERLLAQHGHLPSAVAPPHTSGLRAGLYPASGARGVGPLAPRCVTHAALHHGVHHGARHPSPSPVFPSMFIVGQSEFCMGIR